MREVAELSPSSLPITTEEYSLAKHFDVLTPYQFLDDFIRRAATAQKRVALQAMYMYPDHVGMVLEKTLLEAAARGLDVTVCSDYFSLMVPQEHMHLFPSLDAKERQLVEFQRQMTSDMFSRLEEGGVNVILLNKPSFLNKMMPAIGRNHIKGAFVDDVAYIGGLNYGQDVFNGSDFEVVIEDPDIVDVLECPAPKTKRGEGEDYEIELGETKVLIDTGKPGRSLILDRAVQIAYFTDPVRFANPLAPDGPLRAAFYSNLKRGVEMYIVSSNTDSLSIPIGNTALLADWMTRVRYGTRELFTGERLPIWHYNGGMHDKLLIGGRKAIFGSHNFNYKGVMAGTQERAILSSNPTLVANLTRHHDNLLKKSQPMNPART